MKNIFSLILCLMLATAASGQLGDFRLGVQVAPTFNWMKTDNNLINSNGVNTGIHLGLLGDLELSEHFLVQIGAGLSFNRGGTLKHDIGGNLLPRSDLSSPEYNTGSKPLPDGVDIKYSLQYIEIPVSLKMRTREFGYTRIYLEAPIINWGLLTQARGDISGTGIESTERENIRRDLAKAHLSLGFGGGIEYSISQNNVLILGFVINSTLFDVTADAGKTATTIDDRGTQDHRDDEVEISNEFSKGKINSFAIRLGILF